MLGRLHSLTALVVLAATSVVACSNAAEEDESEGTEDAITMSTRDNALIDVPFYFAMPKSALSGPLNRQGYSYPTLWNPAREESVNDLGLRVIAVPEPGAAGTPERRATHQRMAKELASSGTLQDGDIVLSFRPNLADTMAYPHIQMGSTHAGIAFTKDNQGFNVDQPLDGDYNVVSNGKFAGRFDSLHYAGCVASDNAPAGSIKCKRSSDGSWQKEEGTEALHILRVRNFTDQKKANLRAWLDILGRKHAAIRDAGALNFNKDYLKPLLANPAYSNTQITTTKLGKILTGQATPPQDFDMFCSELVFHLLQLANCTEADIREAGDVAACADESAAPFKPMRLVDPDSAGLADGPLLNLVAGRPDPAAAQGLLASVFTEGSAPLSSGHRAVAQQVAPLMSGVQQYYGARLMAPAQAGAAAAQLNGLTGNVTNYSPTAFLVNAALPADHPDRKVDYVATVVFTPQAAVEKARRLAQNPVP